MALELGSLRRAVDTLSRALDTERSFADAAAKDKGLSETLRAGVIQSFEVAYEQCWKMIQRWLRANRTPEAADNPRTRKELFRSAAREGLVRDPVEWFRFGEARNVTSHIYDEDKAAEVHGVAAEFAAEARFLLEQLEARND
ncbi:MAG: HI0074 family nucleotidyltransferase substrate-binding subunit [Polyangia bacterium]